MGKRKATRVSPGHVEVQCDVWLTAKPPKKQKVLSRDPLHFYNAKIRDEPTLLDNVPKATKQTTLSDFFSGKGKDLRTGKKSCHTPELHPTEHYRILHEIRSSRDNITLNARVVESEVKQEGVKTRTPIFCKQLASHHRDESTVNDRFLGSHDNQKCTFQRPSNAKHQGRSRLQESERNVLQGSLRNERQDYQEDSEDEDYDDDDDVEDVSVDVDSKMMRMSDQSKDKDAFLKHVTGLGDFPTRGRGSHIPDFVLPKSTKASSNDRSVNPPVDDLPCRITLVSLRQAEMSPLSQETEVELVGHSACSQSSMPDVLFEDLYTQPHLHVDRLRYVDPDRLDTAPGSQTDTTDSGDDQLITTQSLADLSEDLSVVDPAVLEVNTADMPSTEELERLLSEDNVHYRYPAPMVDQSPLDSLEFTIGTEGCWLLKRPSADDVNDSYADDSQMF